MSPIASSPTLAEAAASPGARTALIIEQLLAFLWRQWARLGVAGDAAGPPDRWLIDPEALLLFTLELGRYDPRLFDEALDWCAVNGEWLSVQRLKALSRPAGDAEGPEVSEVSEVSEAPHSRRRARTLGAVAAVLYDKTRSARWRTLLAPSPEDAGAPSPVPFFREPSGEPLPQFGKTDPHFLAAGLSRSPVVLRGLSIPPPLEDPACLILRLRALFGLDPRAEAVAYLLSHPPAGAREVARATGYAPSTVHAALTRLSAGGFLLGGPRSGYEAERDRWRAFLGQGDPPVWIAWACVLPAVAAALAALAALAGEDGGGATSPYLRASRQLRQGDLLRQAVTGSGLSNPFGGRWPLHEAEDRLHDSLLSFARQLSDRDGAENPP